MKCHNYGVGEKGGDGVMTVDISIKNYVQVWLRQHWMTGVKHYAIHNGDDLSQDSGNYNKGWRRPWQKSVRLCDQEEKWYGNF